MITEKCKVVVKDGKHIVLSPKGEELPYVIKTVLTDSHDEVTV